MKSCIMHVDIEFNHTIERCINLMHDSNVLRNRAINSYIACVSCIMHVDIEFNHTIKRKYARIMYTITIFFINSLCMYRTLAWYFWCLIYACDTISLDVCSCMILLNHTQSQSKTNCCYRLICQNEYIYNVFLLRFWFILSSTCLHISFPKTLRLSLCSKALQVKKMSIFRRSSYVFFRI